MFHASPSVSFKITFPTKPSQTITSQTPLGTSLASTLPTKFTLLRENNSKAALVRVEPLFSSTPIFTSPTFGLCRLTTLSMYMLPIIPNSRRFSGLHSAFAPASMRRAASLPRMGYMLAIAGLSIPGILPSIKRPPAIRAPLLPAETNKSASPDFTMFIPFTMEESFLTLTALTGESSMEITSLASQMVILSPS